MKIGFKFEKLIIWQKAVEYISEEEFNPLYKNAFSLMNMMVAFKKKIQ